MKRWSVRLSLSLSHTHLLFFVAAILAEENGEQDPPVSGRKKSDTSRAIVKEAVRGRGTIVSNKVHRKLHKITHCFDVWHRAKKISVALQNASRKRALRVLLEWAAPVRNHFWFCCRACNGDAVLLRVSSSKIRKLRPSVWM